MRPLLLFLLLFAIGLCCKSQRVDFYGNAVADKVCAQYGMKDDKDVQNCMDKICEAADIPNHFVLVPCPNINNCFALYQDDIEYIVYDINFFNRVKTFGFTEKSLPTNNVDWAALTVLAHELGHHVNQHTTNKLVREMYTPVQMELQADEYAGTVLYKLGATLAQAQQAMYSDDVPQQASFTHPARADRLAAIAKGWQKEYAKANNNQPLGTNNQQPATQNPQSTPPGGVNLSSVALQNMVLVQGGTFNMGNENGEANQKPMHSVTLSSFYISKYEVTVAEFKQFVETTNYNTDAEKDGWSYVFSNGAWQKQTGANWRMDAAGQTLLGDSLNKPVLHVSWNDAVKYCQWKSSATHQTYRLPTEAEWEYAARGGTASQGYPYSGSANAAEAGWVIGNSGKNTHPVGLLKPNELGLYDMTGNAYEWCADWYGGYNPSPASNPQGTTTGTERILRGGSWYYTAKDVEVFIRGKRAAGYHSSSVGFRVACGL